MAFLISCPCECGESVTASDFGFSETSMSVEPCEALRHAGVISSRIRKSAAYAMGKAWEETRGNDKAMFEAGVARLDALVVLGGAS